MDAQERWYLDNLDLKDQVVADVGANVGRLSQFFFDRGSKKTRVVSIEPVPTNIKAIEARIRKAGAKKRWTVKKCAVSDHDGHIDMRHLKASWGDNAMVAGENEPAEARIMRVACQRLEKLVPEATLVKVDVEGHEYAFLPQALEALPGVHAWALELHQVPEQPLEALLRHFADRGFSLFTAGRRNEEPNGAWLNVALPPTFTWDQVPGMPSVRDGVPGLFKMLHVIARR